MKTQIALGVAILLAVSVFADEKAGVKAAGKKLADKGSYSWTTTMDMQGGGGNFRPGPTEGQTDAGTVHVKMNFGERSYEAVAKGQKVAVNGGEGWQTPDEMEGNRAFMARRFQNYKAPAQEAQDLAEKAKTLKKDGDAITGELTEEGAKEFLSFGRRADSNRPAPKNAKGNVKFWVKDGALTKYQFNVKGTVAGRDDQEMDVDRTTTVEIKNVGSTKLSVPEEAKKKIS